MSEPAPLLDRANILALFADLSDRLAARAIVGHVFLVGGAAMAVAYSTRRVTRDVDAVFEPKQEVYRAAAEVAADRDIPGSWLNDAVKAFLPGPDVAATTVYEGAGIQVAVASPRYLLAMKLLAARPEQDRDDLLVLCRLVGVTTPEQALELVEQTYPQRTLRPAIRFLVEELLPDPRSPRT